jgi:hypothetical protein
MLTGLKNELDGGFETRRGCKGSKHASYWRRRIDRGLKEWDNHRRPQNALEVFWYSILPVVHVVYRGRAGPFNATLIYKEHKIQSLSANISFGFTPAV